MSRTTDSAGEGSEHSQQQPDMDTANNLANTPQVHESSAELVERALVEFESPLIGYAKSIVHDLDRARDIVQDTFIRLYQQDAAKVRDGLKSWLFTVCRNRALDVLRKEKRMVPTEDSLMATHESTDPSPDQAASQAERIAKVKSFIDRLPENQATVILMKFEQGLSYQEISEQTGLSSGNVGFLIHTGLKRLRSILPDDIS